MASVSTLLMLTAPTAHAADVPLALTFSDAARDKLMSLGERVTVAVHFYGEPTPGITVALTEDGQVYLGREEYDLWPRDQTIHAGGSVAGIPEGIVVSPMMNVNVYSSRIADENNLLDCGIVDDAIASLADKTQTLSCKLIGE